MPLAAKPMKEDHGGEEADPEFNKQWDKALDEGTDMFEDRMRQLALEKGGFLPTMAILRARRRDKWGDRLETITHSTLHIYIGPAPSVEELKKADSRMLPGTGPAAYEAEYRIMPALPTPEEE